MVAAASPGAAARDGRRDPSPHRLARRGGRARGLQPAKSGVAGVIFSAPPRNRATSSSGRCVADRPIRWGGRSQRAARRSSDSARWAPRLVGTSAWISSMMIVSHRSQRLARVRGQEQVERLGRGDEDVGRLALKARPFGGRRIAGADGNRRGQEGVAARLRNPGDAGERRAQVALDVDRERLERRHIEHPAAALLWAAPARTSADPGTTGTRSASCRCRSAPE